MEIEIWQVGGGTGTKKTKRDMRGYKVGRENKCGLKCREMSPVRTSKGSSKGKTGITITQQGNVTDEERSVLCERSNQDE